jgi:hypothetical protein
MWLIKLFTVLCLCDTLYCKCDGGKFKRNSINRVWVVNSCNQCALYYLNFRNFKLKIELKLGKTICFAYKL